MNLAELQALQTEAAQRFISRNRDADPASLALASSVGPDIPLRACVEQISCRQKARLKLPGLYDGGFLFEPVALQQCSGEATARYKAGLLRGRRLLDMTCGLGIDSLHFARSFAQVDCCETNPVLGELLRVNARTLGQTNLSVLDGDGVERLRSVPDDGYDWIYVDPSRRSGERRSVDLRYCQPDVTELEQQLLAKAARVCIKLSPGFDIARSEAIFNALREIQVLSVAGECKELLLFLSREPRGAAVTPPLLSAVLLEGNLDRQPVVFSRPVQDGATAADRCPTREIESYFYDPDPAVTKAGLVDHVASLFELQRICRGHSYLTSRQLPPSFPGRAFAVVAWMPWRRRAVAEYCRSHLHGAANIGRRDFPLSPEQIRAMLGLAEGGEEYLFFTRLSSGQPVCVHCRRVQGRD